MVHAKGRGEGPQQYYPEVRERHIVWPDTSRFRGRLRSLHLPPPDSHYSKFADVLEETVINTQCLWDCYLVSPSEKLNHF